MLECLNGCLIPEKLYGILLETENKLCDLYF